MKKYHNSIKTLPIVKWAEIYKTETLKPILKYGKLDRFALVAYRNLQDEMVDYFGLSHDVMKVLKNKIKIQLLLCDIALDGDRTRLIFIEKLEQQNEELQKRQTNDDIYEAIFHIQKHLPYKIDLKTYTVFEFYNDSNNIEKMVKLKSA